MTRNLPPILHVFNKKEGTPNILWTSPSIILNDFMDRDFSGTLSLIIL
jgi:hypothetical protein